MTNNYNTTNISLYHHIPKNLLNTESLHGYKDFIRKSGFEKYSDYNVYIDNKDWRNKMHADAIKHFLTQLENADNKSKNEIENILVNIGSAAVPVLVEELQCVKGAVRGVVAMSLIRIGEPSVECLKKVAEQNKDFEWVAKYLISEIKADRKAA